MGYRDNYRKTLEELTTEELEYFDEYRALRRAKSRLRMYANLFNRDMRKTLLNEDSRCIVCHKKGNLQIDHIKPISKGGKNTLDNIQIMCSSCNLKKNNNDWMD